MMRFASLGSGSGGNPSSPCSTRCSSSTSRPSSPPLTTRRPAAACRASSRPGPRKAYTWAELLQRVFLIDFQTRADPFYKEALRRVHEEKAIGEIAFGEAIYHATCPFGRMYEAWRKDPEGAENRLRAVLGLTADGTPVMQFLNDEGVPTFTAPPSMQGSAKAPESPAGAEQPAD